MSTSMTERAVRAVPTTAPAAESALARGCLLQATRAESATRKATSDVCRAYVMKRTSRLGYILRLRTRTRACDRANQPLFTMHGARSLHGRMESGGISGIGAASSVLRAGQSA